MRIQIATDGNPTTKGGYRTSHGDAFYDPTCNVWIMGDQIIEPTWWLDGAEPEPHWSEGRRDYGEDFGDVGA